MDEGTFTAPPGASDEPSHAPGYKDRTGAVKVAAGLNLAWGGILVIGGIIAAAVLSTVANAARNDFDEYTARDLEMARSIVLWTSILLGGPFVLGGAAVFARQSWGRVLVFVVSGFGLLMVPFGTLIAITSFWALTRPGAERWFGGDA